VLTPRAFATLIAAPIAILLLYGGYPNWHGGWSVGPRYLASAIPFVIFPLAFVRVRAWHAVLFGASVTATALTTLTFPFPPLDFPLPWGTLALPLLRHGLAAPNLTRLALVPFAIVLAAILLAMEKRLAAIAGVVIALAAGAIALSMEKPILPIERAYIEDVYFDQRGALERSGAAIPGLLRRRAQEEAYGPVAWR